MKGCLVLMFLISSLSGWAQKVCLSEEEQRLYQLIMEYRKSKNLKAIPWSTKLTRVAQAHVRDLQANFDDSNPEKCNVHSWSSKGSWTPCCYTNDHAKSGCMWAKPKEISGYASDGYEIAYFSSEGATALEGLEGWKESRDHNPLLINSGTWSKSEWKAIGIGIFESYCVVWFGELEDKSKMKLCE